MPLELHLDKNAIDSEKFNTGISKKWKLEIQYDSRNIQNNKLLIFK